MPTEYKTKLVKQIKVNNNGTLLVCRYDNGLLYQQNRSKDVSMCLDDFLDRLNITIEEAKKRKYKIEITDVPIGSNWPTK